ncbi:MAG: hypothetical protein N3A01_04475 [Bacteroidales bacterium]|nr:hypothetical protein [Bacteroidales bacterium]
MNNKISFAIIFVCIGITVISCKKDKPENENQTNSPKPKPTAYLVGPSSGTKNIEYVFYLRNYQVGKGYYIDWGDGSQYTYLTFGLYGGIDSAYHKWTSPGTYQIRIKEKDTYTYEETAWSDPFTIVIKDQITFAKVFSDLPESLGQGIIETSDGSFLVIGHTNTTYVGDWDVFVIKTDKYGNKQWIKYYGQPAVNDYVKCFTKTPTNEIVIVSGVSLIKINENGDQLLFKPISWSANVIKPSLAGGYIATGDYYSSYSGNQVVVWKLDDNFNIVWEKIVADGYGVASVEDNNGNIVNLYKISGAPFIAKLTTTGDVIYTKKINMNTTYSCDSKAIFKTNDNKYMICGITSATSNNVYFVKTDTAVNIVSEKYVCNAWTIDKFNQSLDNGYLACGTDYLSYIGSCLYYFKVDENGNVLWQRKPTSSNYTNGACYEIIPTSDGGYAITGFKKDYTVNKNFVILVKTDSDGNAPLP